jgi:D-alanine-D-alanine ligase-like ATP-grasp enzyme/SAM-dependent methyltransferase
MSGESLTGSVGMKRSFERIKYHYEVERELADRLRSAPKSERKYLYTSLYNELFSRVPDHPQNVSKLNHSERLAETERQFGVVRRFITSNAVYLEIGAGDCSLAVRVARDAAQVYALDVSDEISRGVSFPENCKLLITDGTEIPVPPHCVDVAFSNQLMEHLHPDDATEQLAQIFQALRPGGVYICVTPNRLSGPHDVSNSFDTKPRGFHLREYSNDDLIKLYACIGFNKFRAIISYHSLVLPFLVPLWPILLYENTVSNLPERLIRRFALPLNSVKFVAFKAQPTSNEASDTRTIGSSNPSKSRNPLGHLRLLVRSCWFRIERLALGRVKGGKRRMQAARAAFYQSMWENASAAAGATLTRSGNDVIEMRRGGVCLRARENETEVDDLAVLERAGDKFETHQLLSRGGLPVPGHILVTLGKYDHALSYLRRNGGPLVVKPASSTGGGAGVTTNVFTAGELRSAMSWARSYGKDILIERQIEGDCYRILFMDGEHIDSIRRDPPTVVSDGRSTIRQLLRRENQRRLEQGAKRSQVLIAADRDMANTLARQGLGPESRPAAGMVVRLKQAINENALQENSAAATLLCADIIESSRDAAELVGVRLAGVDVICRNPSLPLEASGGAIIEVNTQPGLYYHDIEGRGSLIAQRILERYFESGPRTGRQVGEIDRGDKTAEAGSYEAGDRQLAGQRQ